MKHATLFILAVLVWVFYFKITLGQSRTHNISGLVRDAQSGESLPGANVFIPKLNAGASCNAYGFYTMNLPEGKHELIFSFVGYSSFTTKIEINAAMRYDVMLQPSIELEEVEIVARSHSSDIPQIGVIRLPINQVLGLPSLLGEKDLMKTLQLMPGIQRGKEGTGGLYVRGGGYDQNLIILDDATVYNASHLFGFFSLFNGDAIKDVKIIKGGFPARYGGRLSSVLDITMREGNMESFSGEAGIGLISSRFTIEGPVSKGKSSFLLSGRRTYLDWLINPFLPEDEKVGYYFYDLNAKFNYIINDKNRIYFSSFLGKDQLNTAYKDRGSTDKFGLQWQNMLFSLRLNTVFSGGLFMNNTLLFSQYGSGFFIHQTDTHLKRKYSFNHRTGIQDYAWKSDFMLSPSLNHTLRFGITGILHEFRPRTIKISNEFVNEFLKETDKETSFESAAYIENEYQGSKWMYNVGLRLSYYKATDLVHFHPEPRISIGYRLTPNSSLKAAYTDMNQYIHLLSTTGGLLPTDIWLPATGKIIAQNSRQFGLSYDRFFKSLGTELIVETYYKKSSNVLTYRDGANFFFIDDTNPKTDIDWTENVTGGRSDALGFELLLHKKTGQLNGWLAYTWSKALVQFDEVNNGKWYPANFDRRHDIALTLAYTFSPQIQVSAAWSFLSGNPITLPYHTSATYKPYGFDGELPIQQSHPVDYYGSRNNFRTDNYHRLDLSMQLSKQREHGERIWEIGIYNAYNKKNAFAYTIANQWNTGKRVLKKTTIFPLIPSVTYVRRF